MVPLPPTAFDGCDPATYDLLMGPAMFEPYALDLVGRVDWRPGIRVLEVAAGTGRVTRHLVRCLPENGFLVASDLNEDMLAIAQSSIVDPRVEWKIADAQALPFADGEFDVIVCQFGAMFFPDKVKAYSEACRVLKPGGTYFVSAWGSHDQNPWAKVCHRLMHEIYPSDPITFLDLPFGYHDPEIALEHFRDAGFSDVKAEWVQKPLVAPTAAEFAFGVVSGTRISVGVLKRGDTIEGCAHMVSELFAMEFGPAPMESTQEALLLTARKAAT
jgi:SAM-dependent methyltransferase